MKHALCSLWLVILGGCTLGTRALTPGEQAVVRDLARECSPHADEAQLREYTNSQWNHAPAWMRWLGRDEFEKLNDRPRPPLGRPPGRREIA